MSSVLVSAWVGADNLGDELLFQRLHDRLRDAGADHITVVSLDPRATRSLHGVDAVHPRNLLGIARAIRNADLVVVGPGGLLQDKSSPFNLPYQLHRAVIARLLRTPVVGLGLGADPMSRRGSGTLLRLAFGTAAAVVVRDEPSVTALAAHRVTATATADLAVATEVPAGDPTATMVVSLRPWRDDRSRLPVRWQRHELVDEQITATAEALDTIAERDGLAVRFVAFEPHTDHPLHEAIADRMHTNAECVVPELDTLVATVADAQVVVATRFHAGIVALVAGRPLVSIGYAPKVTSLATLLDGAIEIIADDADGLAALPDAVSTAVAVDAETRAVGLAALRSAEAANADVLRRTLGG